MYWQSTKQSSSVVRECVGKIGRLRFLAVVQGDAPTPDIGQDGLCVAVPLFLFRALVDNQPLGRLVNHLQQTHSASHGT